MTHMKSRNLLFLLLITIFSCEETIDCENILASNLFQVTFYNPETNEAQSRAFDSVKAVGIVIDSVLFDSSYTTVGYSLPLNYNRSQTDFVFHDSTGTIDTLRISYDTQVEFFGNDCGSEIHFSNLGVVMSTFDSAVLISNQLDKLTTVNLEIYD